MGLFDLLLNPDKQPTTGMWSGRSQTAARGTGEPPNKTYVAGRLGGLGEPPNQTKTRTSGGSSSDSGSGSGGSGGVATVGAGASVGAPKIGSGGKIYFPTSFPKVAAAKNDQLKASLQAIEDARMSAQQERASLDQVYGKKKDELRQEYRFSESPEEKAQIARILGNLEKQRDDGYRAIGAGYAEAIGKVEANAGVQSERSGEEALAIAQFYNSAADSITADAANVNDQYAGYGVNADGGTTAGVEAADASRATGAADAALSQRLGGLGAEDAQWLASTMGGEREAQQADLGRLHMVTSASAQETQASRVQARIAAERAQWRDQLASLQGQFTQRGWQLGDFGRDMQVREGDMRFQAGESMATRRQSAAEANQRAAQVRQQMQQSASEATAANRLRASIANASNSLSASKANASARSSAARFNASQRNASSGSSGGYQFAPGERDAVARIGMTNDLGPAYTKWLRDNGVG